MGGVVMAKCLIYGCKEEIEEEKLFCQGHWGKFPPDKQEAIFNAWTYGDLEDLRGYSGD